MYIMFILVIILERNLKWGGFIADTEAYRSYS